MSPSLPLLPFSFYHFTHGTPFLPITLSTRWTPFPSVALSIPLTSCTCTILIPSPPLLAVLRLPSLLYVFPVLFIPVHCLRIL